jgi:hypothetical protein
MACSADFSVALQENRELIRYCLLTAVRSLTTDVPVVQRVLDVNLQSRVFVRTVDEL